MSLAVVILNWNNAEQTQTCVDQLLSWSQVKPSVWVVDNASREPFRAAEPVHVLANASNRGFGGGNNFALRRILKDESIEHVLLLNADTRVSEATMVGLLHIMKEHPEIGVLGPGLQEMTAGGPRLCVGGRNIMRHVATRAYVRDSADIDGPKAAIRHVDYVPGTAGIVRMDVLRRIGLFDEDYFFSGEMADLCARVRRAGMVNAVAPALTITHEQDDATGLRETLYVYYSLRNRFLFVRKHGERAKALWMAWWAGLGMAMACVSLLCGRFGKARAAWFAVGAGLAGEVGDRNDLFSSSQTSQRGAVLEKRKVSVVIPNWNGKTWLQDCLAGLTEQTFKDAHIIIVDNASTDGSVEWLETQYPNVDVLQLPRNRGFAGAVNHGVAQSQSEYIALLNTDTRPGPTWLAELVGAMDTAEPDVASLASCMLEWSNTNTVENAGDILTWHGAALKRGNGQPITSFQEAVEVLSPCAGAALYRRSALDRVGEFDESFFAYLEDVDWGLRARICGYRAMYVPTARVMHHGHASDLPHGRYVRWITRNRLLLLWKNLPTRLLLRHAGSLLYGQWYFFLAYRRPLHVLAGILSALPRWPRAIRQRKQLWRNAQIGVEEVDALLSSSTDWPTLRSGLKHWLGGKV